MPVKMTRDAMQKVVSGFTVRDAYQVLYSNLRYQSRIYSDLYWIEDQMPESLHRIITAERDLVQGLIDACINLIESRVKRDIERHAPGHLQEVVYGGLNDTSAWWLMHTTDSRLAHKAHKQFNVTYDKKSVDDLPF